MTIWSGECGRITTLLGKLEFKLWYFFKKIKILFFIILFDFFMDPVVWFLVQCQKKKNKEICKR
jgi:hypothetical protein